MAGQTTPNYVRTFSNLNFISPYQPGQWETIYLKREIPSVTNKIVHYFCYLSSSRGSWWCQTRAKRGLVLSPPSRFSERTSIDIVFSRFHGRSSCPAQLHFPHSRIRTHRSLPKQTVTMFKVYPRENFYRNKIEKAPYKQTVSIKAWKQLECCRNKPWPCWKCPLARICTRNTSCQLRKKNAKSP